MVVRRKLRSVGIWVNRESIAFRNVPGYYFVASSSPLEDIAPRRAARPRTARLRACVAGGDLVSTRRAMRTSSAPPFHRDRERDSLYKPEPGVVEFIDERLFRTTIDLPAHVPTGEYQVEAMLMVGGEVISTRDVGAQHREGGLFGGRFHLRTDRRGPLRRHCYRARAGGRMAGQLRLPQGLRTRRDRCHDRAGAERTGRGARRRAGHFPGLRPRTIGHSEVAARFAALRAKNSGGQVALLHVVQPPEFQHWAAVGELMRARDARGSGKPSSSPSPPRWRRSQASTPSTAVREGGIGDEILGHIGENESINLLVVGAAPPDQGHGSLIFLARRPARRPAQTFRSWSFPATSTISSSRT